jgi:tetratricopeptide (TPR) repeat protein
VLLSLETGNSKLKTGSMTKENILYSIIGVLLGVLAGYVFASTVNQRGYVARTPVGSVVAGQSGQASPALPQDHPPLPSNEAAEQPGAELSAEDQAAIEQAEADPKNFDAQMRAAEIQYKSQRFKEAIQLLVRANQLRPQDYGAIVALGNANFDANNFEIAEKWYTAALVKKPQDVNVRTDLGLTFLFRKPQNVDRAIQEFRRSLATDPRHEQTLQNMVFALIKKGDYAEAEAMLGKLREVSPNNPSLTKLDTDLKAAQESARQPASKGT